MHAATGDDDRALLSGEQAQRVDDMHRVGRGPERRHRLVLRLDQQVEVGLDHDALGMVAADLQVHRARRAAGRLAESLAHHVGQALDVVDVRVELGGVVELGEVLQLLVGMAVALVRRRAAGDRDHRRAGEVRVAQPGR